MTTEIEAAMNLIAKFQAMPKTHRALVTYADGRSRHYDSETRAQADNFASREARKIGRDLLDRETGKTVRVVSVEVFPL
jgi:hypothetical protein